MDYIDIKTLEEDSEERGSLVSMVAASLEEAVEQGITQVRVAVHYRRLLPTGVFDNPRPSSPFKVNASTASPETLVDKIINQLKSAFGRGFTGQVIIGIESVEQRDAPLAGVWDRNVQFGDIADSPYGMAAPGGGQQGPPMGMGGNPHGGGPWGGSTGGGGSWGGAMAGGPSGGSWGGSAPMGGSYHGHGPPPPSFAPMGGSMVPGGSYDPGRLGPLGSEEDREMIRSILASFARREDMMAARLQSSDDNLFRLLSYMLQQNRHNDERFMLMLDRVFGRVVPPAPVQGGANPVADIIGGLLGAVFPWMAQKPAADDTPQRPSPPELNPAPPHQQTFFDPNDPRDLNFGDVFSGGGGSYQPEPEPEPAPAGFRPPQTEDEWMEAMRADPEGAKAATGKLIPAAKPFIKMLDNKG